ncbi:SRPBCC domain-containing protein [Belliella sp. DSM 107340]|uniref:SRPBCC domain-containing protein n=1 Tax=Belliella calami TaxID=2923436 RepID=A0ABS9UP46_9BACT|nr:SRPBCC domain-containing protein [Belliella calami]MCH7398169.1 SRPBCC domain-containing protein [Belliella calami]
MESIEQINYIKAASLIVYEAITKEEGLATVWTKKLKVKQEVGFVNEFDFDEGYLTKMKITELEEGKKVVWECIDSDEEWIGTFVSFEISQEQSNTKIVLKHYNWKEKTDYFRWCGYNWAMFLKRLKDHCENEFADQKI